MAKHANKIIITRVLLRSWEYLDKNFHKFSTQQKIQIALDLCKKNLPQEFEGGEILVKHTVQIVDLEERALQLHNQRSIN